MRIIEEYLKRHSLRVPFLPYVDSGHIYLRTRKDERVTWSIVQLHWEEPFRHCGRYYLKKFTPLHNSRKLVQVGEAISFMWDEYETFLIDWAASHDTTSGVSGTDGVTITAWEMFVFTHDNAEMAAKYGLSDEFLNSLDDSLPKSERFLAYLDFLPIFRKSDFYSEWKSILDNQLDGYLYWLSDLIVKK